MNIHQFADVVRPRTSLLGDTTIKFFDDLNND
jgi:hypothetical protein